MRFIDRICQQYPRAAEDLFLATKVKLQNVADLFETKEEWPFEDFPTLAPPWPLWFGEYDSTGVKLGVLVRSNDLRRLPTPDIGAESAPSWMVLISTFIPVRGLLPNGTLLLFLGGDGKVLEYDSGKVRRLFPAGLKNKGAGERARRTYWSAWPDGYAAASAEETEALEDIALNGIPLLAISLLNCKNARPREVVDSQGIPKVATDGRETAADDRWYELEIDYSLETRGRK